MVGALLLALVSAHYDVPRSSAAVQRLREHLLTGLDSFVPPDTDGTTGIQIGIQYRFFKVISVDLASGKLVTKIWRRMLPGLRHFLIVGRCEQALATSRRSGNSISVDF